MPAYYDLPNSFALASVEDADKYQKLPFYLTMNEVKQYPKWNIWDQMFGTKDWEPNMGSIMRGVRPEPSPIQNTFFFPANVTTVPRKNMFETQEVTEEARVKWHQYESKNFSFVPSFQDFRKNQVQYAHDDLVRQIGVNNNQFLRSVIWQRSPNIFVCSSNVAQGGLKTGVPTDDGTNITVVSDAASNVPTGEITGTAGKTTNWIKSIIPYLDTGLTLKAVNLAGTVLREDMAAPFFDGVQNMPKDNELIKGKYVIVGSTEAWSQLVWDPALASLKSINMELTYGGLQGNLFGFITYKADPFPIRFDANGLFIPPQIQENVSKKVRPNPDYIVAPYEIAFIAGADAYKSIKVGPPPSEFAKQNIGARKFYSMRWNGEVQITDQILITTSSGGNITSVDTNRYGNLLRLQAQVTHGIIAGETYNLIPILFKRFRTNLA